MTGTFWPDISYYQEKVNDSFAGNFLMSRIADGTWIDPNWQWNQGWCKNRENLIGWGGYYVFENLPVAQQFQVIQNQVGALDPRMVVMIDIESWSGRISGNHSTPLNQLASLLADWLGDWRRVLGYGNHSDLAGIAPNLDPRLKLIVAAYGSRPTYPNMIGWQYSDGAPQFSVPAGWARGMAPFGACDMNYSDLAPLDLAVALGIAPKPPKIDEDDMASFLFSIDSATIPPGQPANMGLYTSEGGIHWVADGKSMGSLISVANTWAGNAFLTISFGELRRRYLEKYGPGANVLLPTGADFGAGAGYDNKDGSSWVPLPGIPGVSPVSIMSMPPVSLTSAAAAALGSVIPTSFSTPPKPVVVFTRPESGSRAYIPVNDGSARRWVSGTEAHTWPEGYTVTALTDNDPFWALPSLTQNAEDLASSSPGAP